MEEMIVWREELPLCSRLIELESDALKDTRDLHLYQEQLNV